MIQVCLNSGGLKMGLSGRATFHIGYYLDIEVVKPGIRIGNVAIRNNK